METKTKHTPWLVATKNDEYGIIDNFGKFVCFPGKDYAELIVRAVNSHDALVEALKQVLEHFDLPVSGSIQQTASDNAEAALAKARGE